MVEMILRAWPLLFLAVLASDASAECRFQGGEYVNPFESGCGDVILEFTESESSETKVAIGYPVPVPVDAVEPGDYFRTYDALLAGQQAMMLEHDFVHGEVVGVSHGGEDIWAYRIGSPGERTVYGPLKGAVMAVAGVHPREWQPPEVVAETFERMVAAADDGGVGQYLVDNLVVVLVPMVNPDGFRQTQAFPTLSTADPRQPRDGRMRRKNLHHPTTGDMVDGLLETVEDNFYGVDLNRNHPRGFQSSTRNTQVRSLLYAGSEPHSEQETLAALAAVDLAPGERLRLFMDIHSFTQIYLLPETPNQRLNELATDLARSMRSVTGFRYQFNMSSQHFGMYSDYFALEYEVPSWTLETEPRSGGQDYGGTGASHSGFITPDDEIARLRDELADTFLLGFYRQAGPPAVIAADIFDSDGGLVWSADRRHDGAGGRTLELAADGALQPGGEYTLWLAFDKPMRWREDGAIAQFRGQAIRLMPSVTLEVANGSGNREITLPTTGGSWLDRPGPGPDGFLNYRDDAFALDFTLPSDLPGGATEALLVIEAVDMSGQPLDAAPSTVTDWADGGWQGYEDGLPDCTLPLWIGDGTRGTHALRCNAERDASQPEPPPATPEPPRRSGGGSADWPFLLALAFILAGGVLRSARARHRARHPGTSGR